MKSLKVKQRNVKNIDVERDTKIHFNDLKTKKCKPFNFI